MVSTCGFLIQQKESPYPTHSPYPDLSGLASMIAPEEPLTGCRRTNPQASTSHRSKARISRRVSIFYIVIRRRVQPSKKLC